MKLLHKQLLVTCTPYLALIVGVLALHHWAIEPTVAQRFRKETRRELDLHGAQIRLILARATAQLRLIAQFPAFRGAETEVIVDELQRLNPQIYGPFEGIYFLDAGRTVHAADGTTPPLFAQPIQEDLIAGREIVTDAQSGHATQQPVFQVQVPVISDAGLMVGAVIGELAVTEVLAALQPNPSEETTVLFLEDAKGHVLSQKNASSTGPLPSFQTAFPATISRGGLVNSLNSPFDSDSFQTDTGNWVRLNTSVPGTSWKLGLATAEAKIFGPTRRLKNWTLAMLVLGLIITAGGVFWRNRSFTRRVADLTEALQRFGAADQTVRTFDQGADELGQIAEAFNCMAEDIAHAQKRLRKQFVEMEATATDRRTQVDELRGKITELERYASFVAHDLKAPLVTMQGFAAGLEAAAHAGDWDRFRDDAARIQRTGDTLKQTVDTLLELARLEQGTVLTEDVSLHQAAAEAVELLRGPIEQRHIAVSIADDLPTVQGHAVLWRQVFQNLIDNAVQACDGASSPRMEIGSEQRSGETVCFVRDNGSGIDPAAKARLFDPMAAGSGLGLALVKRIVELHHGRIWAESDGPGRGTAMYWSVNGR